jgi:hypothetical protein
MVSDLATAEDVVQDAFEQLHRRWRSLRRQSSALDYARAAVPAGGIGDLESALITPDGKAVIAAVYQDHPASSSASSSAGWVSDWSDLPSSPPCRALPPAIRMSPSPDDGGDHSPVAPSIRSRSRSAWPRCRAYSSIMCR